MQITTVIKRLSGHGSHTHAAFVMTNMMSSTITMNSRAQTCICRSIDETLIFPFHFSQLSMKSMQGLPVIISMFGWYGIVWKHIRGGLAL